MEKIIRWGILGPGKIALKFASGFEKVKGGVLHAVASRDQARVNAFADKFNIPVRHTSYEALAADPDVDVIYVATPHTFHHANAILCLQHGKAVVCEKPLTLSRALAGEMIEVARKQNVFLMEGMWSRFFPAVIKVAELVKSGAVGDVKFMQADFGFSAPHDPQNRVLNLALGGGAQLDVGVYPMFLALLLLGKPATIHATGRLAETGADETASVQFTFKNGEIACILSSIVADSAKQAYVAGSLGSITMQTPWHKSQCVVFKPNSGDEQKFEFPFEGFGFDYEIQAVTNALLRGEKESTMLPLDFSLLMAETADEILRQLGVRYR